jgi:hypothetical protein
VNPSPPPQPALPPERSANLNTSKTSEILWESAWSALVLAFLAQLFGTIVVSIVGWMWHDMTPSMPPGMERKPHLEAEPGAWDFSWFQQHRFALLFAVFFLVETVTRMARHAGSERQRKAAAVVRRLQRRVSAEWVNVLVVNAVTAFVTVLVIQITQQFTFTALVWSFVGGAIQSLAHMVASAVPGGGLFRRIGEFFGWYQENQFKFLFWFLYAAAISDDLGLPNFKTLGRYLGRRWCRRRSPPAEKPAES